MTTEVKIQITVVNPLEQPTIIQAEMDDFSRVLQQVEYYHTKGALAIIIEYINVLTPSENETESI